MNLKAHYCYQNSDGLVNIVNAICHLFQLSLAESDISKIGTIKVEGIINPTNAEIDLKDGIGK